MTDRPADPPAVAAARHAFFVLGSTGLVVAALYLGQRIFVPLALALLLTLLLGPVVSRLERLGLKRLPAVLSVVCVAFLLIGLAGWAVVAQFTNLLADIPQHKTEVREKIVQLRGSNKPGPLGTVQGFLDEIEKAARPPDEVSSSVVRVEPEKPSLFAQLQAVLGRFLGTVSTALVVIFLIFALLLYREDTRNRLIRLAGRGRMTVTTRALDEAGQRIGGYLLRHSAVNAGFGTAIGLGLAALGVPYPVLWGMLAAAFRFVPVVGVWLVAPAPALLAFVSGPGLLQPVWVFALFLVLDQVTANFVEPWVCGRSVGLAPVPLLLAVTFWTGLWGLVGFVLATPVTVCLAVLGKHVRPLRFLAVLLSREAALRPAARYYQRLLARDRCEAEAVVKEYRADHSVETLFDRVLVPALVLVRRGKKAGGLRPEDEEFILRTTREIVAGLGPLASADPEPLGGVVLGVPAVDGADEAALVMLRHLAQSVGTNLVIATGGSGVAAMVQEMAPVAVLVAAVGPGGLTEAGYLCRRLRSQHPGVKILVGRWGCGKDPTKARAFFVAAGAERVAATLREVRAHLTRLVHSPLPTHKVSSQAV
jgi:predicted PurR-regulated permease PerM